MIDPPSWPPLFAGCPVAKIVSGGQTGVDRAALAVAIFLELEHGGWCPQGRRAEDGVIPEIFELKETEATDYAVRTQQNVIDSDGTLILYRQRLRGGTRLTLRLAQSFRRPFFLVDLKAPVDFTDLRHWLIHQNLRVLNVAGPRESSAPGITLQTERFLIDCFREPSQS